MPLWSFHHGPGTFTRDDKIKLGEAITALYTSIGLPAFYVNVLFQSHDPIDLLIGGKPRSDFVNIQIYHVARSFQNDAQKQRFMEKANNILRPFFEPKSVDWEYFITESPKELWRINGLVPPEAGTEMEKVWLRENRPVKAGNL